MYFNFRFYNPLRVLVAASGGSRLGSPVTSGVTRRQSRVYFVDCNGILTPILRTMVQKSTLLLQKRGHAEVLKKTPSSAKYVTKVRPPSVPECPPRARMTVGCSVLHNIATGRGELQPPLEEDVMNFNQRDAGLAREGRMVRDHNANHYF